ncbi:Lcl C-terminal domain-containing protein [Ilyomonas limi]|nr:DUF1566 domain-containing protein [Ilyomonas limi]
MKAIIKTSLSFFLLLAVTSCTKERINSTATQSLNQTATAADASIQATLRIGDMHAGGIIFYLDSTKKHGLVAATKDQSSGIKWYNNTYIVTGAKGTIIGTGASNTTKIVNKQGSGKYAAKLCADLVLNGFSDWYLPSKQELNQLYKHRSKVPGLAATNYWSSTESDTNNAWDQEFGGGFKFADDKSFTIHVRAVRSF